MPSSGTPSRLAAPAAAAAAALAAAAAGGALGGLAECQLAAAARLDVQEGEEEDVEVMRGVRGETALEAARLALYPARGGGALGLAPAGSADRRLGREGAAEGAPLPGEDGEGTGAACGSAYAAAVVALLAARADLAACAAAFPDDAKPAAHLAAARAALADARVAALVGGAGTGTDAALAPALRPGHCRGPQELPQDARDDLQSEIARLEARLAAEGDTIINGFMGGLADDLRDLRRYTGDGEGWHCDPAGRREGCYDCVPLEYFALDSAEEAVEALAAVYEAARSAQMAGMLACTAKDEGMDRLAHDIFRACVTRGAVLCDAWQKHDPDEALDARAVVERVAGARPASFERASMRKIFVGGNFSVTAADVLRIRQDRTKDWVISMMLQETTEGDMWALTVMDTESGLILGCDNVMMNAAAKAEGAIGATAVQVLHKAMAGGGGDIRAPAGPPERPGTLLVAFRMRDAFASIKAAMDAAGVFTTLESQDQAARVCALQGTDIATGGELTEETERSVKEGIVGQMVMLHDLSRVELNGCVGVLLRWHADRDRWELRLLDRAGGEGGRAGATLAVKPFNLHLSESMATRLAGFEEQMVNQLAHTFPERSAAAGESLLCPVCLEDADQLVELPCTHRLHRACLLRWLKVAPKPSCPMCRVDLLSAAEEGQCRMRACAVVV